MCLRKYFNFQKFIKKLKKDMMMSKSRTNVAIIASAIIWGGTIIACAIELTGTPYSSRIVSTLSISAAVHLILIWGSLKWKK